MKKCRRYTANRVFDDTVLKDIELIFKNNPNSGQFFAKFILHEVIGGLYLASLRLSVSKEYRVMTVALASGHLS